MKRLHVLAKHLRVYDLLGIGLAMLDGSYWDSAGDYQYPEPPDCHADISGGDGY